jgi:predicted CXXCH cytochrome family protein
MLVDKQDKVCFECHTEIKDGLKGGKSRHAPVSGGECTKCHSPHQAKLNKLLLAQGPDLCLTCHKDLKEKMQKEKTHSPAGRDCLRCHGPHFTGEGNLLAKPVQALCSECHNVKEASFGKAHFQIDPAVMNCVACHTPHASKDPKFFKEKVHAPFAGRSCEDCHLPAKR